MALSMAPLLIHNDAVPARAREALQAAQLAAPEQKNAALEDAARILHRETSLDCSEARDLLGLPPGNCR